MCLVTGPSGSTYKNSWWSHCLKGVYFPVSLTISWVIIPPQNELQGEIWV